jgi:hypothetical protein
MLKPNEFFKVSILQDTGLVIGLLIWINPFLSFLHAFVKSFDVHMVLSFFSKKC